MHVTVEPLGPLRSILKAHASPARIELVEGATVSEALGLIGIPTTASWNASIDGRLVYADQVLRDGDHVLVFAPIAGGCDSAVTEDRKGRNWRQQWSKG